MARKEWEESRKEVSEKLKKFEVGEKVRKEVSLEDFGSFFKELAAMVGNGNKAEDR